MNADFFKAQMFGMPRWAWFVLLGGGVALGLYFRKRSAAAEAEAVDAGAEDEYALSGEEYALDDSYDPSLDPSLAGMGVYPEDAGYYPWQSDSNQQVTRDLIAALLNNREQAFKKLQHQVQQLIKRKDPHPQGGGGGHGGGGGSGHGGGGGKPHGHNSHLHGGAADPGDPDPRRQARQRGHQPTGGGPPRVGPHRRLPMRSTPAHRQ